MCLSRLTLRLTQPSPRCRPSWLTHACEDQTYLKPPSLEKKKKNTTQTQNTHVMFQSIAINNLKTSQLLPNLLSPRCYGKRESGGISRLQRREPDVLCSCWQLQAVQGRRSVFCGVQAICAIWPRTRGQLLQVVKNMRCENCILCKQEQNSVSLNMKILCIDSLSFSAAILPHCCNMFALYISKGCIIGS